MRKILTVLIFALGLTMAFAPTTYAFTIGADGIPRGSGFNTSNGTLTQETVQTFLGHIHLPNCPIARGGTRQDTCANFTDTGYQFWSLPAPYVNPSTDACATTDTYTNTQNIQTSQGAICSIQDGAANPGRGHWTATTNDTPSVGCGAAPPLTYPPTYNDIKLTWNQDSSNKILWVNTGDVVFQFYGSIWLSNYQNPGTGDVWAASTEDHNTPANAILHGVGKDSITGHQYTADFHLNGSAKSSTTNCGNGDAVYNLDLNLNGYVTVTG